MKRITYPGFLSGPTLQDQDKLANRDDTALRSDMVSGTRATGQVVVEQTLDLNAYAPTAKPKPRYGIGVVRNKMAPVFIPAYAVKPAVINNQTALPSVNSSISISQKSLHGLQQAASSSYVVRAAGNRGSKSDVSDSSMTYINGPCPAIKKRLDARKGATIARYGGQVGDTGTFDPVASAFKPSLPAFHHRVPLRPLGALPTPTSGQLHQQDNFGSRSARRLSNHAEQQLNIHCLGDDTTENLPVQGVPSDLQQQRLVEPNVWVPSPPTVPRAANKLSIPAHHRTAALHRRIGLPRRQESVDNLNV